MIAQRLGAYVHTHWRRGCSRGCRRLQICASYKAEKSIGDVHQLNLELPMLEYHK